MVYKKVHRLLDADLVDGDVAVAAAIAKSKISTSGTWVAADIPTLDAVKIGTGVLDGARGALSRAFTKNFGAVDAYLKYIIASDNFQLVEASISAHDILSASHGDALAAAVIAGDIIIGNATPKWSRLAKGTVNYILAMGASLPAWTAFNDTIHGSRGSALHSDSHTRLHTISDALDHSGGITATQHGALSAITSAHAWADINKVTSSIGDVTTRDHHILSGLSDDDHTIYLLAAGTRLLQFLKLANLTADPALAAGIVFYRSDLGAYYVSYDGTTKKQIMTEGLSQAEGVLFGNGFSDTLPPSGLTKVGNGVLTATALFGVLTSGAALNDKTSAYCIWSPTSPAMGDAVYGKYPQFELYIYIPDATNIKIWVLWGGLNNVGETAVNKRFGIKIVGTALWGLAADGAALTETDLATTLAQGTWYKLRVKHTGSNITVWKDGVEIATKVTANLPSGSDTAESCVQVICANTIAADKSVRFKPLKMMHGS